MRRWALGVALCCCVRWSAHAQNTAGELFNVCDAFERGAQFSGRSVAFPNAAAAECFSYFTAIHQLAYFHVNNSPRGMLQFTCPPSPNGPGITQFIRVFMAYSRANPQNHHLAAQFEVLTALAKAYPCSD